MAHHNGKTDLPSKPSDRQEIETLLAFAEKLNRKRQRYEGRLLLFMLLSTWLMVASLVAYYYVWFTLNLSIEDKFTFLPGFIGLWVGLFGTLAALVYRLLGIIRRDLKTVREIAGVLREIEQVLDLTALERAAIKIRLSQFDIGSMSPRSSLSKSGAVLTGHYYKL